MLNAWVGSKALASAKQVQNIIQIHELASVMNRHRLDMIESRNHPWKSAAIALILHTTDNVDIEESAKDNSIAQLCHYLSTHFLNLGLRVDGDAMKSIIHSAKRFEEACSTRDEDLADIESVKDSEPTGACAYVDAFASAFVSGDAEALDAAYMNARKQISSMPYTSCAPSAKDTPIREPAHHGKYIAHKLITSTCRVFV
jgi:hypothetical protein